MGLTDGLTYKVHRIDGTHIALTPEGGGADIVIGLDHAGAPGAACHVAGEPLRRPRAAPSSCSTPANRSHGGTAPGAGHATDGTTRRHREVAAPRRGSSADSAPPSGNGITSASATGGGGSIADISQPTANLNIGPLVKAYIAGSINVGGDVNLTSNVTTHSEGYTENGSGGIISIPSVDTETGGTDNNTAFIGKDFAPDGITGDGVTAVDGGGILIIAAGNIKILATTYLQAKVGAKSDSGGGFDASDADAKINLTDNTATVIGQNARVKGSTVRSNTTTGGDLKAHAESFVLAFIGSSSADPQANLTSRNTSILDGDSSTTGTVEGINGVDIRAYHESLSENRTAGTPASASTSISATTAQTNVSLTDTASGTKG